MKKICIAAAFGVGVVACGPASPEASAPAASASGAHAGSSSAAPYAAPALSGAAIVWQTRLDRDHALVGKIWSVAKASFVEEAELRAALRGYVLLGEKHDNPDHHALQARLIGAMVAAGRHPAVAFEQFEVEKQGAVDGWRRAPKRDTAGLAQIVDWDTSGWPPWAEYAPIAEVALRAELPILATGLSRERLRAMVKAPKEGGPALDVGASLGPEEERSLRDELRASHCGKLPEAHLDGMMLFQRARDAAMASALVAATTTARVEDAVLIAGTGHTREDRGVGKDLTQKDASRPVTSVAFVEVAAGEVDPAAYAARWNTARMPFDYVWFTPRANDDDPCKNFGH